MLPMIFAAVLNGSLVQQSPRPGAPTPYATTIEMRTTGSAIVIRFDCTDPDPSRIATHTMQHDSGMDGDDSVSVVLDTFGDRRSGYFFSVNAAGARAEGLISDRSGVSLDWDGVWDAAVARTPKGWSAEMTIPASTLRFSPGVTTFGFNAERRIPRDDLVLRYASPTLDSSLFDLARAGVLSGIEELHRGNGQSAALNGIARADHEPGGSSSSSATPAVDATWEPNPGASATVSIHTDFAETEADGRQINLSRFPLFFPEKRRFFADGANQFQFGYGLGTRFVPFYSRRIGLVAGDIIPIEAGTKFLLRSGRWGVAAVGVRTGDSSLVDSKTLAAARATYDVDAHLRVGAIATSGDPDGSGRSSLVASDAVWNTSAFMGDKNLVAAVWGARSSGARDGTGWGATFAYPNDRWNAVFRYDVFGDALDAALGFLPRPGTRRAEAGTNFEPRLTGEGSIRKLLFQIYGRRTVLNGETDSSEVYITPFGFITRTGARFELNIDPRYERVDDPFPISEKVEIRPGRYHFDIADVQLQSRPDRPLQANAILAYGTFYDGHLREMIASASWSHPSARLQLEIDSTIAAGTVSGGAFAQRLYQLKAVYALSPRWVLSSYTQFDNQSHTFGMNNRLRWTLRSNADLFIVWNRGWRESLLDERNGFSPSGDQLVAKIRWIVQR